MEYKQTRLGGVIPDGWINLVDPLVKRCEAEGAEIHQIKAKLGGLSMSVAGASVELNQDITDAVRRSFTICEICGEAGERRTIGANVRAVCYRHLDQEL